MKFNYIAGVTFYNVFSRIEKTLSFAKHTFALRRSFQFFLFLLFIQLVFSAQSQTPFTPRSTWDGPFDIRMIAAPNLQPVYINAGLGNNTIRADSVIPYHTIMQTNTLLDINNRYKNDNFLTAQIPMSAVLCKDLVNGCGNLGLPTRALSTTCPTERYDSPTMITRTVAMSYSDYDTDLTTFSSSMAQLDISKCSEVEAAYLYWSGNFKGGNRTLTLVDGPVSTYSGSGDVFNVSATSGYENIKLKVPGSNAYQNVTALAKYTSAATYVCVANVTNIVRGIAGGGQFWAANIQSYPIEGDGGSTSGWNLVIVFRSPLSPPRLISLYDGFTCVNGNGPTPACPASTTVTLNGLQAPATANFKSYIGFAALDGEDFAYELAPGDPREGLGFQTRNATTNTNGPVKTINPFGGAAQDQPDYKLFSKKGYPASCDGEDNVDDDCKIPLYDASWCSSNDGIGSSKITTYNELTNTNGNEMIRLPSGKNTLGIDAHHMILPPDAIVPGATQATLTLRGGKQGGMTTYMAYIAIEKLQPKLILKKEADKDQTTTGVQRSYTLTIINAGNQTSFGNDVLTDTLDPVTKFVTGSVTSTKYVNGVTSPGTIGNPTIASVGNMQGLNFTIPAILRNDSLKITFRVNVLPVTDPVAGPLYLTQCKRTIFNTAWIEYKKNSLNELLKSKSNSGECNDGSEVKMLITGLGNTPTTLTSVSASGYRTESIIKHVRRQIFVQGHAAAADTADYVIYDLAGNRIYSFDAFPATGSSVTYEGYRDLSGAGCQDKISITFTFCTAPTITGTLSICGTGSSQLTGSPTPAAASPWVSSNTSVATVSNSGLVAGVSPGKSAITYKNSTGCIDIDTVTVNPVSAVTPMTASICSGAGFSVTPVNTTNGTVLAGTTYTWAAPAGAGFTGGTAQAVGQTSIAQTLINTSNVAATAVYTVTPTTGTCVGATFTVTVTINPKPVVTAMTATICSGDAFTSTPSNTTNGVVPAGTTYTWTAPTGTGFTGGSAQAVGQSSISQTLTNTSGTAATAVYTVTPTSGTCPGTTFTVTVTVNPKPAVTAMTATVCNGSAFSITPVNGTNGTVPSGTTYTWTAPTGTGFTGGSAQAVAQTSIGQTLTNTTNAAVTAVYTVTPGSGTCPGATFTVSVTINPVPAITNMTIPVCSGAAFAATPANGTNGTVPTGTTYTWSAPTGSGFTGGSAQATAQTAISQTLTNMTNAAVTATYTVTPTVGSCPGAAFTVIVTINPKPAVTSMTTPVCSRAAFTATPANGTNGDVPAGTTYTWSAPTGTGFSGGSAQATGQSSISQTLTNTSGAATAVYTVTPTVGTCSGNTFTVTVTVNPSTVITTQPAATTTLCEGQNLSLNVVATGTAPLSYKWKKVVDTTVTTATLSINGVVPSNAGSYTVEVTGGCGSPVTSNAAVVTINTRPVITTQPALTASDCAGGTVTLSVAATGTPAPTYQWFKGAALSGKTTPTLTLSPLTVADAGTYTVEVTNSCGKVTSTNAVVSVTSTVSPSVGLTISTDKICGDGQASRTITLTASPTGGGAAPTYTFEVGGDITGLIGTANQSSSTAVYTVPANMGTAVQNLSFTVKMTSNSGCIQAGSPNPATSNAVAALVDPRLLQTQVDIIESRSTICTDRRTVTFTPLPGSTFKATWSTTSGAGVAGGVITNIAKDTKTLTTYKVETPLNLCPSLQDTVTTERLGDMTSPLAGSDQTICGTTGFTVNLTGNSTLKSGETVTWAKKNAGDPGTLTQTGNNATVSGLPSTGSYTYELTMTNGGICPPATDEVTITVVAPPVAEILKPEAVTSPATVNHIYNSPSVFVEAKQPATGYTGAWTVTPSGPGSPIFKNANATTATTLTDSLKGLEFDQKAILTWTVSDNSGKCPAASAKINIERKNTTIAKFPDDSICINQAGTYVLTGTGLLPGETGEWSMVGAGATILANSGDNGKTATLSGIVIPANAGQIDLQIKYKVNPNPAIVGGQPSEHIGKITVFELSQQATTGGDQTTCTDKATLTGNIPSQPTASGMWTKGSSSEQGTLTDATIGNIALTGLSTAGETNLIWTIKNQLCPATTATMKVTQAGQMTAPKITVSGGIYTSPKEIPHLGKADTLCAGTTFTVSGNQVAGPPLNETGVWRYVSGPLTITDPTQRVQTVTPAAANDNLPSVWEWIISSGVGGCSPETTTVTLNPRSVPALGRINGNAFVCEGTDTAYSVNPGSYSSLPVSYAWGAGTNPGALRTGPATGTQSKYKFFSNTDGSFTSALIEVTPSNRCGAGALIDTNVTIRTAPRDVLPLAVGDTIGGPVSFCASSTAAGYIANVAHPQATTYTWSWENSFVVSKSVNNDSAFIGQPTHWDLQASADKIYTVKVELSNRCSDTARKNGILPLVRNKQIKVIAPVAIDVTLNAVTQFCIPDEAVFFDADSVTSLPGLKKQYEFLINSTRMQLSASDKYTAPVGTLKDGDIVRVRMIPDASPKQCIIYRNPEATKVMEGFQYPNAEIDTLTRAIICEDNPGGVVLSVKTGKTSLGNPYHGTITWTKDSGPLPQYNGLFTLPALHSIYDGGAYTVTVTSNSLGCAPHVSQTVVPVNVYIFEKPAVVVLKDPFAVPYVEGFNGYRMPVVVTKPVKDVLTESLWTPDIWLEDPTNPNTLLIPEKKELTQPYFLYLQTGDPSDNGKGCVTPTLINVVYYLPVIIPNAFSPNGDGLNDNWVITGLGKYPNTRVKVYNRWGSSMYVDNDGYKVTWDGTHNGQPLPTGTYYYIVELKGSPDDTDENRTGSLTIIR